MPPASLRTRLFVTEPLGTGLSVTLTTAQTHYLQHVLRLTAGVEVALFNGRDGEWSGRIATLKKDSGSIQVETVRRTQITSPDIWLLFAPIKRNGIDLIAEKATELGVRRLVPVLTRYTDVTRVNLERLTANALEAAQQCARLDVPEVMPSLTLEELLENWPTDRRLFVCAESGPTVPVATAFRAPDNTPPGPAALLTGPEGGFAPSELDQLTRHPSVRTLSLGPRILRAETAALAALTCWQALCGDWISP